MININYDVQTGKTTIIDVPVAKPPIIKPEPNQEELAEQELISAINKSTTIEQLKAALVGTLLPGQASIVSAKRKGQ